MAKVGGEVATKPMAVREDLATKEVVLVTQSGVLSTRKLNPPSTQTWAFTAVLAAGDFRLVKANR